MFLSRLHGACRYARGRKWCLWQWCLCCYVHTKLQYQPNILSHLWVYHRSVRRVSPKSYNTRITNKFPFWRLHAIWSKNMGRQRFKRRNRQCTNLASAIAKSVTTRFCWSNRRIGVVENWSIKCVFYTREMWKYAGVGVPREWISMLWSQGMYHPGCIMQWYCRMLGLVGWNASSLWWVYKQPVAPCGMDK